jgi:hypothetical protein
MAGQLQQTDILPLSSAGYTANSDYLDDDSELLRALTLDPARAYRPLNGRWPVHDVLQPAAPSTMS